ncbi:MAG: hypothetical protein AAGD40_10895, partial [Pseudomonadota bacterium]
MADSKPGGRKGANQMGGGMNVDTELVRTLATMLDDTALSEIEVADGDRRIRVARQLTAAATAAR